MSVEGHGSTSGPLFEARPLRRLGLTDVYLGIALVAVLVARFVPFEAVRGLLPCPLLSLFDLPCFTCGFTRAWMRMAHLEVASAVAVSPLGALLFVLLVLFVITGLLRLLLGRPSGWPWPHLSLSTRMRHALRVGVVLVVVANWGYLIVAHRVWGTWH